MTSDPSRKRKRDALPSSKVTVQTSSTSSYPPVLTTTRGITLPPAVSYKAYTQERPERTSKKSRAARPEYLLHGEKSTIAYTGTETPGDEMRHYVGVFDPVENTLQLYLAPKLAFQREIREFRKRDVDVEKRGATGLTYAESQAALGLAFGTRRAQKALHDREMNKIDTSKMGEDLSASIIAGVARKTENMLSTDQLQKTLIDQRPIPEYNEAAEKPEDVYRRESVVTDEEWECLYVEDWIEAGEVSTPFAHIRNRATQLLANSNGRANTQKLKLLRLMAAMINFWTMQSKKSGKMPALTRAPAMLRCDMVVAEGLYKRFSDRSFESPEGRDGDLYTVSPAQSQKCLFYLAVAALLVDNCEVDIYDLKNDLGITPKELSDQFKHVGCKIRELTKTQMQSHNMTTAEARQHKRAVLEVPLVFPTSQKRGARRR